MRKELKLLSALTVRMVGYVRLMCERMEVSQHLVEKVQRLVQRGDPSEERRLANEMGVTAEAHFKVLSRYGVVEAVRLYHDVDAKKFGARVRNLVDVFSALEKETRGRSRA